MIRFYHVRSVLACTFCLMLSLINRTHGQSIFAMRLLQEGAKTDDQPLSLQFHVGTANLGSIAVLPSATRNHDTIIVEGCYFRGERATPREFFDTVMIGVLPAGKYTLIGHARTAGYDTTNPGACIQRTRILIDSFVVTEAPVRSLSEDIILYPSPTTCRTVKIVNRSKAVIEQVSVFNAYGQKLDEMQQPAVMNLSGLATGIYLLHIKTDKGLLLWKQVLQ